MAFLTGNGFVLKCIDVEGVDVVLGKVPRQSRFFLPPRSSAAGERFYFIKCSVLDLFPLSSSRTMPLNP